MTLAHYQDPDERDDARYDPTLTQRGDVLPASHPIAQAVRNAARKALELQGEQRERIRLADRAKESAPYRAVMQEQVETWGGA